jgi:hypothetical protein
VLSCIRVNQETLVSLLVGSAVSIAATWIFAHVYYVRAGRDLTREAERLRQETGRARELVNTLARAFEAAGLIDVTWGPDGELSGVAVHLAGAAGGRATVSGTLTVTREEDQ